MAAVVEARLGVLATRWSRSRTTRRYFHGSALAHVPASCWPSTITTLAVVDTGTVDDSTMETVDKKQAFGQRKIGRRYKTQKVRCSEYDKTSVGKATVTTSTLIRR
jgi:hypothetical protein